MTEALKELLDELDALTEKQDELSLSMRIAETTKADESLEAAAERMAFSFQEDYKHEGTSWGTYFGPGAIWEKDGQWCESPSLSLVTEEVLDYWVARAGTTGNPFMRARYAGLVWDFTRKITGENPDYKIAILYAESLVDVCDSDLCTYPSNSIVKITRAYRVARSINNTAVVARCINSAIHLEERIGEDSKPGLWGFCFELFVLGRESELSGEQKEKLIINQESRLTSTAKVSPWACESAGVPLATYYRSAGQQEDVRRVIEQVGLTFESACEGAAAIQASSWYQHAHSLYINFNLSDKAESVSKKIAEVGPDVIESMESFSHSMEIPQEELERYLEGMTEGGLDTTLKRIAAQFVPNKDMVEKQVLELAREFPISYLFTKTLQDHKGRPVATIGGIEDDLAGNTIHQYSKNLQLDSFFLRHSIIAARTKYRISVDELSKFVFQSPIFEDFKKELVRRGLAAFLEEDYVNAIHLLIPQIEAAIRNLVELMGGVTLRKNRQGGLQLRTFDDLLRDELIELCFGADTTFYLRILLTDQRGWNLRNDVCHGICLADTFNYGTADRVFHALLCLARVRQQSS